MLVAGRALLAPFKQISTPVCSAFMATTGFSDQPAPRSPIKVKPRRQAGDTLRREFFVSRVGVLGYAWGIAFMAVFMTAVVWWFWWWNRPWTPWLVTGVAVAMVASAAWLAVTELRKSKNIELGLEGELTVGQMLERIRVLGYEVLHDIPGEREGTNIDHVLVGPGGVFVIETKTWSKVGDQKIEYDGKRITIDGHDRSKPLGQARACRDDVQRRLTERFPGRDIPVRAIVVFAGWFVSGPKGRSGPDDVWVLNEGGVAKWIANEDVKLSEEAFGQIAAALQM